MLSQEGALQVKDMSVTLAEKKITVAQAQKDCEELLVVIVQDKREVGAPPPCNYQRGRGEGQALVIGGAAPCDDLEGEGV